MENLMYTQHHVPAGWRSIEKLNTNEELHLIIALKQRNVDRLMDIFNAVSDPNSKDYGKFLTMDEIHSLVAPAPYAVDTVVSWLKENNAKSVEHKNDFLEVTIDALDANKMLACEFHRFEHQASGKRLIRSATAYSVPAELAQHIDFVGGVTHFPKVRKPLFNSAVKNAKGPGGETLLDLQVTPWLLRGLYSVGDVQGKSSKNSQCVAQFLEEYYTQVDLDEFFLLFYRQALGNSPTLIGPDHFPAGTEASLDIQYIMSVGANVPTVFWSNPGRHEDQEPFLKWLVDVDSTQNPPYVISVSYGDDENSLSFDYTNRINIEFVKQGVRGISFLFASGDDGVGGGFGDCNQFVPNYPASSPFVTAVGGTTLDGWFETGNEVVNGLSGGGFSNYFFRPNYQREAVNAYLVNQRKSLPPTSYWNTTGRAYPDVSALSANYVIVTNLIPVPGVAGTSCAAPVFSGVMALLNDLRLQNGKSPLGFLNPLLYDMAAKYPKTFTDITQGSNPGCGTDGFPAAAGWDPSSGLGSPNYAEMAKVILNY
jgi:tripeptidyl-peptidase-1